jgi:hypothetical protein
VTLGMQSTSIDMAVYVHNMTLVASSSLTSWDIPAIKWWGCILGHPVVGNPDHGYIVLIAVLSCPHCHHIYVGMQVDGVV